MKKSTLDSCYIQVCSPYLMTVFCLLYNYYMRLVKINRDRILYSAFTIDQDLAQENSKCWFSTLNKIVKILKT